MYQLWLFSCSLQLKQTILKTLFLWELIFFFMIKYSEDIFLSDNQGCKSRVRNSAAFEVLLSLFLVADCGVWTKYKEQEWEHITDRQTISPKSEPFRSLAWVIKVTSYWTNLRMQGLRDCYRINLTRKNIPRPIF